MAKQKDYTNLIEDLLPDGHWEGDRYITYSPFRKDNTPGGAFVIFREGNWIDEALPKGEDTGSILKLVAAVKGIDEKEAKYEIKGKIVERVIYRYHDTDGFILVTVRANYEYGGKMIKQGFQGKDENDIGLTLPPKYKTVASRPLYHLPELLENPNKPVLVVEGEKCAEAVKSENWILTTWMGGAGAVHLTDWSPLKDRKVTIWPDNDAPGHKAAQEVNAELDMTARIVDTSNFEEGEDIADLYDRVNVQEYIRSAKLVHADANVYAVPMSKKKWVHTKGRNDSPVGTMENFKSLMSHYGVEFHENLMSHKVEITFTKSPERFNGDGNINNASEGLIISIANLNGFPSSDAGKFITTEANDNRYHPVKEAIESIVWDRKDRLVEVYDLFHEKENFPKSLKETLLRKWLLSCIAALYETPYRGRGVLTLQGPQSIGKTSVLASLFRSEWFEEGMSLDPRNKDSVEIAISKWVVELGELEGVFKKSDIASLKAFITKENDSIRLPYERRKEGYPRRTVFCATVNEERFLTDMTGNSRFWVLPVVKIDYMHNINILQLWAQVLSEYRLLRATGEQHVWWLDIEEEKQLANVVKGFTEINPMEELLLSKYDIKSIRGDKEDKTINNRMSTTDVMRLCGIVQPKRFEIRQMDLALEGFHFEKAPNSSNNYQWVLDRERMKELLHDAF